MRRCNKRQTPGQYRPVDNPPIKAVAHHLALFAVRLIKPNTHSECQPCAIGWPDSITASLKLLVRVCKQLHKQGCTDGFYTAPVIGARFGDQLIHLRKNRPGSTGDRCNLTNPAARQLDPHGEARNPKTY